MNKSGDKAKRNIFTIILFFPLKNPSAKFAIIKGNIRQIKRDGTATKIPIKNKRKIAPLMAN